MKKIVEYKTISDTLGFTLDHNVTNFMEDGWQPFGSPYYIETTRATYQAMVKYEEYTRVENCTFCSPTKACFDHA